MPESTSQQREHWKHFKCHPERMAIVDFGPDRIRVAPPTEEAWQALARVFRAHRYPIRIQDTDSYNCREIKGGGGPSLHSYGIALDVNWQTNPFKQTQDGRPVIFSGAPTLEGRMEDVKQGRADTDMTKDMIDDVLAIKTKGGKRVFEWGGNWTNVKDAMHFEIDLSPKDLSEGIDWSTVVQDENMDENDRGSDVATIEQEAAMILGSTGDDVKNLQAALLRRGYTVGGVDGVYGPATRDAVKSFQRDQGLPETGEADPQTLARVMSSGGELTSMNGTVGPVQTADAQLLRILADLARERDLGAAGSGSPAAGMGLMDPRIRDLLLTVLRQKGSGMEASVSISPAPAPSSPTGTAPPVLSPIDQVLGGEALAGKKTLLAVVAYVILSILQATNVAGTATGPTATPTGQLLTTLITAFGGLGVFAKFDRVVKLMGIIAGKTRPAP